MSDQTPPPARHGPPARRAPRAAHAPPRRRVIDRPRLRVAALVLVLFGMPASVRTASAPMEGAVGPAQSISGSTPPPASAAFPLLVGSWAGEGTLFGASGAFTMEWAAVGAGAYRLRYTNPALRAEASYAVDAGGAASGTWTDDRPATLSLRAEVTDSVVTTEWSNAEESGRTEYRIMPDGTARTRDWVGGRAEPFAEATYRRVAGS